MTLGNRLAKIDPMIDEKEPMLPRYGADDVVDIKKFKGASFTGSVFNLSCSVVGAGIMSLPSIFKLLGVVPAVVLVVVAAILTEASIELLLRYSKPGSQFSYSDVMGEAYGKPGRMLVQICVIINNIGAVIIYLIIIGVTPLIPFVLTTCFRA